MVVRVYLLPPGFGSASGKHHPLYALKHTYLTSEGRAMRRVFSVVWWCVVVMLAFCSILVFGAWVAWGGAIGFLGNSHPNRPRAFKRGPALPPSHPGSLHHALTQTSSKSSRGNTLTNPQNAARAGQKLESRRRQSRPCEKPRGHSDRFRGPAALRSSRRSSRAPRRACVRGG